MTLRQAFKVWWSYSWRASLLLIPLGLIMAVVTLAMMPIPRGGLSSLDANQLAQMLTRGGTAWILSLLLTAAVQIFAMRWALNARWSDFRLQAVPVEPSAPWPRPPQAPRA